MATKRWACFKKIIRNCRPKFSVSTLHSNPRYICMSWMKVTRAVARDEGHARSCERLHAWCAFILWYRPLFLHWFPVRDELCGRSLRPVKYICLVESAFSLWPLRWFYAFPVFLIMPPSRRMCMWRSQHDSCMILL